MDIINFHQSANSFHLTLVLATFQPITDEDGLFDSESTWLGLGISEVLKENTQQLCRNSM